MRGVLRIVHVLSAFDAPSTAKQNLRERIRVVRIGRKIFVPRSELLAFPEREASK